MVKVLGPHVNLLNRGTCPKHTMRTKVTKPAGTQYFTWKSVEVSVTPPPLDPDIGRSSYFT